MKMSMFLTKRLFMFQKRILTLILFAFTYIITGCTGDSGKKPGSTPDNSPGESCAAPCTVEVRWRANSESGVNREGGGYRIYYHTEPEFDIVRAQVINVPYSSGPKSPTSKTIVFNEKGTYYLRIIAYSDLNPSGSSGSRELFVKVD
jgi:hypothetical protein